MGQTLLGGQEVRSIQRSFVLLTLGSVLFLSLVLGAISITATINKADEDASIAMNLTCANEADAIDELLEGIEDAVDVETSYIQSRAKDVADPAELLSEAESLFSSIASQTNGAVVYFFQSKGSAEEANGFFYVRDSADGEFHPIPVSDISDTLPDKAQDYDIGWDRDAIRSGTAQWLKPFEINDFGTRMVTYVEPLIINCEYQGVVGMGVDFQLIIDQVESISSYNSGYGFLTYADGYVMYHPSIPFGTNLSEDDDDVPAVDEAIAAGTTTDEIVVYQYQGADKRMAFHLLQNDMRLVLSVNASEIYAGRDRLVNALVISTILVGVVVAIVAFFASRRMLKPLRQLTEAAEQVAAGDLSVELPKANVREVSSLVDAYDKTVGELRQQIAVINEIAHSDALTGFRNKGAFEEVSGEIDKRIASGENLDFTLAMLDVNGLKPVNDTYGHEAGDALLQRGAVAIAKTFECMASHGDEGTDSASGQNGACDVSYYRLGGDEFAVLIMGPAESVSALSEVEGEEVSIACGVARFRPGEDDDTAAVLARADARMYENKRAARA